VLRSSLLLALGCRLSRRRRQHLEPGTLPNRPIATPAAAGRDAVGERREPDRATLAAVEGRRWHELQPAGLNR